MWSGFYFNNLGLDLRFDFKNMGSGIRIWLRNCGLGFGIHLQKNRDPILPTPGLVQWLYMSAVSQLIPEVGDRVGRNFKIEKKSGMSGKMLVKFENIQSFVYHYRTSSYLCYVHNSEVMTSRLIRKVYSEKLPNGVSPWPWEIAPDLKSKNLRYRPNSG